MNKKLNIALSLLIVVSFALAACGSSGAQPTPGGDTSNALCTYTVGGVEYVIKYGTNRYFAIDENTVIAVPCPGTFMAVEHDPSVLEKIDADVDIVGLGIICRSKIDSDVLNLKLTYGNRDCAWLGKGGN